MATLSKGCLQLTTPLVVTSSTSKRRLRQVLLRPIWPRVLWQPHWVLECSTLSTFIPATRATRVGTTISSQMKPIFISVAVAVLFLRGQAAATESLDRCNDVLRQDLTNKVSKRSEKANS